MPRAGLTAARVVAEAGAVADEVGLERLTLAAVAQRFGVSVPSLYKHVRGLDGLNRDLAVRALRELTTVLGTAAVGRAGRDALHAMADAYRDYAHRHPGLVAATIRRPATEDTEHLAVSGEVVATVGAALADYHIDGVDLTDAIRILRSAMHGFLTLEAAGGLGASHSVDETFGRLIDALDATFRCWANDTSDCRQPV